MKKSLLTLFAVASTVGAFAQCNQLFFSEYVEGTHNNKALEIYNPTDNAIDLSNYRIARYPNGSLTPISSDNYDSYATLSGTIGAKSVFVVVIDRRNANATGQDTAVFPALQAKANLFLCADYTVCNATSFNGNDAIALESANGATKYDIFGEIGEDPGNSWTDEAPYNDDQGAYWTENQTLIRKSNVTGGVTTNPSPFIVTAQWDSLPVNTFSQLGSHTCDCGSVGIGESRNNTVAVAVFPNPSTGTINVQSSVAIEAVNVYNMVGQVVFAQSNGVAVKNLTINTELAAGSYFIHILTAEGVSVQKLMAH